MFRFLLNVLVKECAMVPQMLALPKASHEVLIIVFTTLENLISEALKLSFLTRIINSFLMNFKLNWFKILLIKVTFVVIC